MHCGEFTIGSPELSYEQQQIVRRTLRSILDSHLFSKSKRYPSLLEYIVLKTLEGKIDALREHAIGEEVFERPSGYDSTIDPIVRTIAGEVRRRLAAYYSDHPEAQVHIELPIGGYAATFHFRSHTLNEPPPEQKKAPIEGPGDHQGSRAKRTGWRARRTLWGVLLAVLLLAAAGIEIERHRFGRTSQDFWKPVLQNDVPVLIVVGKSPVITNGSGTASLDGPSAVPNTSLANAFAATQICKMLRDYRSYCNVVSAQSATLTELREKSVVMIGALDNPWILRLMAPLRYQFRFEDTTPAESRVRFIMDENRSEDSKGWRIGSSNLESESDYAIIARFHSDITDSAVVVTGGLGQQGTLGAEEFLSKSENLRDIFSRAPKDWKGFNFEAVLQVDVVQGESGPARVVAAQFW